jgi:hypothetical protein
MPAFDPELQMALDEGVKLKELLTPIDIEAAGGDSAGHQPSYVVTLQKMKVSAAKVEGRARVVPDGDKTETLQIDHIFTALAQYAVRRAPVSELEPLRIR